MYIEKLRREVFEANLLLPKNDLVVLTWGNVSGIDRDNGIIAIKPSGVEYDSMREEDIVICDLEGNVIQGKLKPSSDLMTHVELYKNFKEIRGVVHTHSLWATSWAQAGKSINALGTTHADYFYGTIHCTRDMRPEEIKNDYERNTGKVIVETFIQNNINPNYVPGVLVKNHGPFSWGKNSLDAVNNSIVLEKCANMAFICNQICCETNSIDLNLLDKHFMRKHGENAYYGQG